LQPDESLDFIERRGRLLLVVFSPVFFVFIFLGECHILILIICVGAEL
jgi:hypothetical protein